MNYRQHARGTYQDDLLTGRARWSGSDLRGNARRYASRYAGSRRNLLARLVAAGLTCEVRSVRSPLNRPIHVLFVDGSPVSSMS